MTQKNKDENDTPSEIILDMINMYNKLKFKQDLMMALHILFGVCIIYLFWLIR